MSPVFFFVYASDGREEQQQGRKTRAMGQLTTDKTGGTLQRTARRRQRRQCTSGQPDRQQPTAEQRQPEEQAGYVGRMYTTAVRRRFLGSPPFFGSGKRSRACSPCFVAGGSVTAGNEENGRHYKEGQETEDGRQAAATTHSLATSHKKYL